MNEMEKTGLPSWFWYLEAMKIAVLLGARYGLGLGWGLSVLITLLAAVVLMLGVGIFHWMERKSRHED